MTIEIGRLTESTGTEVGNRAQWLYVKLSELLASREPTVNSPRQLEEEQIAMMAVLGGFVIAIGQRLPDDARALAERLAREDIAPQIKAAMPRGALYGKAGGLIDV